MRMVLSVRPGDTLFEILKAQGVPAGESLAIIRKAKPVFNTAKIKPGNPLLLVFSPDDHRLTKLAYAISDRHRLVVAIKADQITARKIVVQKNDRLIPTSPSMPARTPSPAPVPAIIPANYAPSPPLPVTIEAATGDFRLKKVTLKIRKGQNLFTILSRQGIKPKEIDACARSLKGIYNVASLKPGKTIDIWLTTDKPKHIARMSYAIDRTRRLEVVSDHGIFQARKIAATDIPERNRPAHPQQPRTVETLLATDYDYITARGDVFAYMQPAAMVELPPAVPPNVSYREDRSGPDRTVVRHAAVRLHHQLNVRRAKGMYKTAHTKKMFLRAPLRYRSISSGYSKSRMHPVYRVARPHLGIDYAAPIGTKVFAIGEGTVISKGWSGGFGQTVKIRHPNGYVSYYGHLGKYARNLRVGKNVAKGEIIGYVGMTGVTTGPHLDFRISRNGRFINPLKLASGKKPL